ncbi:MAG: pyrroline-5-carboxylate reductase [Phycisphaeraceae bacterium]|nr:MAG: pyrroline-5-carboxylate reductase [Phycisphaeraceae bacterium]
MNHEHPPVAFIGGGNMSSAIVRGASAAGALDESRCVIAEPDAVKRASFRVGVPSALEALGKLGEMENEPGEGQVFLAIKPQMLVAIADEIREPLAAGPSRVVVSILAGTPSAKIRSALGEAARVVRVMPNTPAQVGRGMSAICPGEGALPGDGTFAERVMNAVGRTIRLDEDLMDAFTALSGSGPAYVFYLAEAIAKAGEAVGFTPDQALAITRQVIAGSAELLARDDRPPADLRAAVTSKGGTTAAATAVLDDALVMDAFVRAITAARDRGRELAKG